MIPAKYYTIEEFAKQFPPNGEINAISIAESAEERKKCPEDKSIPLNTPVLRRVLLNDPSGAMSCLVFEFDDLKKNCGQTYPTQRGMICNFIAN